jgi:hypothetical protein
VKFLAGLRENLQRVEEAASCLRFNQGGRSLVFCYLCTEAPTVNNTENRENASLLLYSRHNLNLCADYDFNILQFYEGFGSRRLVLCYLCTEAPTLLYIALKILKIQAYFFTLKCLNFFYQRINGKLFAVHE